MFEISYETIATIISLIFLSITQIILIKNGRTDQALKIEKQKEKQLNKLTAKRNKYISKADDEQDKINKIKENK